MKIYKILYSIPHFLHICSIKLPKAFPTIRIVNQSTELIGNVKSQGQRIL